MPNPTHDPLRRAALRAALAVSTLTAAAAGSGCTADTPPDEIFVAIDEDATAPDAGDTRDASDTLAPDTVADTGEPELTAPCSSAFDGFCPPGCAPTNDADCCEQQPIAACWDGAYCWEGGCVVPGPFRPPRTRA